MIGRWLHGTTEPFDNWDWDGHELTLFHHNNPIEKYTPGGLGDGYPGPSINQPCTTTLSSASPASVPPERLDSLLARRRSIGLGDIVEAALPFGDREFSGLGSSVNMH